ncbi:hypothetical protein [Aporhodopirellula aestuarii]|uniref:Transmembrane protein n=1 Tax=Aporhodopirellula aestuarii TaxID=2950107 RepID=A0ABT0UDB6_9BACT|nr:hypothetical protein [Aporhodopirellula aestuarii]MCM2375034.1 hypothetical protein [Aporhodopirellula aestuarii]
MTESPPPDEPTTQTTDDTPIRRGSPFAQPPSSNSATGDAWPAATGIPLAPEILDPEWGVLRAANWASAWVAISAIACVSMFPAGGVVVAALGCGLATVGLFSSRQIPAAGLLVLHAFLFFSCYQRLF